jgi:hypothetical protein
MRSVGLDLGARHIAYCEVRDGKVVDRVAVRSLEELSSRLGPGTAKACESSPELVDIVRVRARGAGTGPLQARHRRAALRRPTPQSKYRPWLAGVAD